MTQHLTHGGQELSVGVKRYLPVAQYLDGLQSALKQLQLTLEERTSALLDCNGEIKDLSHKLEEYLQEWYPSAYSMAYESKGISIKDDFYVVRCPELHPLPAKDISDGLVEDCVHVERQKVRPSRILILARAEVAHDILKLFSTDSGLIADASREPTQGGGPHLVGANFRCPKCTVDSPVISKRKIEPLSKIASQIEQRLQSWQQIMQKKIDLQKVTPTRPVALDLRPKHLAVAHSTYSSSSLSPAATPAPAHRPISENFPEVAVPHVLPTTRASPTSPRSFSTMSIYSGLETTSRFDPPQKQNGWQLLFNSNRSPSTLVSMPSYTFFACGESLLLWNESGSGFYDLRDANSIGFRKLTSCHVHIAAGGTNTCAIVAKTETVRCQSLQENLAS